MSAPDIRLGDIARDTITGFEGVVVARTEWLNGCWRLTLQPKKLQENGKPIDTETFDDKQAVHVPRRAARGIPDEHAGTTSRPRGGGGRGRAASARHP